jgi:hypothetical protein
MVIEVTVSCGILTGEGKMDGAQSLFRSRVGRLYRAEELTDLTTFLAGFFVAKSW